MRMCDGFVRLTVRRLIVRNCRQETGETAMFNPGGREQFWYEGAVVAILYLFMSASLLGVYLAAGWKRYYAYTQQRFCIYVY